MHVKLAQRVILLCIIIFGLFVSGKLAVTGAPFEIIERYEENGASPFKAINVLVV